MLDALIAYGLQRGLLRPEDTIYTRNLLMDALKMTEDQPSETPAENAEDLEGILAALLDYATKNDVIPDTLENRDLFDTRLMGLLTPRPSGVIARFHDLYANCAPEAATEWYYAFSQDTDYIRRYRIAKDVKWLAQTPYGALDITINLSKPEKDPRDIAAAKKAPQGGYPQCLLCRENEGYAGRQSYPARQNHRIIPLKLDGQDWFLQYSPYVYYNEHCIVLNARHTPMQISRSTFVKMMEFIDWLPHYFIGSNADLPIVGGSILAHDHFQGGKHVFAMERAAVEKQYTIAGFKDVEIGRVRWPMSVLRLRAADSDRLVVLADEILARWREYSDESVFVFAETEGEPHNTITPIARKRGEGYELDLVLRNNIATEEHPLGAFHPHEHLHHIKKENIGLIEVMGLAVLPSRLKEEMALLREAILEKKELESIPALKIHIPWAKEILKRHTALSEESIDAVLQEEIGLVFAQVLEDAGVFKRNEKGFAAFDRFMERCGAVDGGRQ